MSSSVNKSSEQKPRAYNDLSRRACRQRDLESSPCLREDTNLSTLNRPSKVANLRVYVLTLNAKHQSIKLTYERAPVPSPMISMPINEPHNRLWKIKNGRKWVMSGVTSRRRTGRGGRAEAEECRRRKKEEKGWP